jgi:hypothetical protein
MTEIHAEARRSGFADWIYGPGDDLWSLALIPVAFLANVLTHLLVFRAGWTIDVWVIVDDEVRASRKIRYRSKAAALADLDHQRELAADLPLSPPPEPKKPLPTRGGTLRRPW